jgi:hypothetical protein
MAYNTGHRSAVPRIFGKPIIFVDKIPITITSSCIVPAAPRRFLGATSLKYIGPMPVNKPHMIPVRNRANINGIYDLTRADSTLKALLKITKKFTSSKALLLEACDIFNFQMPKSAEN